MKNNKLATHVNSSIIACKTISIYIDILKISDLLKVFLTVETVRKKLLLYQNPESP
jgi:hypothetical protein